jgi:hypothetical protein
VPSETLKQGILLAQLTDGTVQAEAFNVFNHPNFTNPSLSLESPQTFGEYQGTMDPRSMQFALRFEF